MSGRELGRIVGLWRYPVKSMAAEPLDEVEVSWHGLAGDRRWAFVRDGIVRSGFPWLTIRERPEMSDSGDVSKTPRFCLMTRAPGASSAASAGSTTSSSAPPGVRTAVRDSFGRAGSRNRGR